MHERINAFLGNESTFGKLMTKVGIIICANLLFVLFSMPVITIGASLTAMYHVMLKTLRGDGVINPFKQFWKGFKNNFIQSTIAWVVAIVLGVIGYFNIRICEHAGGWIEYMKYGVYALGVIMVILLIYLFPTMAAFSNTIPKLLRNGMYFALHRPWKLPIILFFNVFPLYLTYTDTSMLPLYAFIWFFFGFGAIAMLTARLLIKEFTPYLPIVDDFGDFILTEDGQPIMPGSEEEKAYFALQDGASGGKEKTEDEILEEMKMLDM